MRRTSPPTDIKFMRAQALNRKEEKLLSHKITGFSKTENQLQRELQQIRRTRLSFQQGLDNLNILYSSKDSLDSNRYARYMHSNRRSSTGNLLEVPKTGITKLAGAVTLPDIHSKECPVLKERNETSEIALDDHVTNGDAGGQDRRLHSSFPFERQPSTPRDTEVDSDGLKEELTPRCSESFVAPACRRTKHRRQSLPALSSIVCEDSERESSKGENESENEKENEIESELEFRFKEEEGKTRLIKVMPSITLDSVEEDIRLDTCAAPSKESNVTGRRRSQGLNDQNEVIRPSTCAKASKESNAIGRRRSQGLNDQNEIRPGTYAVPSKDSITNGRLRPRQLNDEEEGTRTGTCVLSLDVIGRRRSKDFADQDGAVRSSTSALSLKESNLPERRLSSNLNANDQKQWLYARRGRRASAPVIMTQLQTPQGFTQPEAHSLTSIRKTNQELLVDECLKGKFRAIGHAAVGNVLLAKSRRNSANALAKRI